MLCSRYVAREHIDINENDYQLDKKGVGWNVKGAEIVDYGNEGFVRSIPPCYVTIMLQKCYKIITN